MVKKLVVKNTRKAPIIRRAADFDKKEEDQLDTDLVVEDTPEGDTEMLEEALNEEGLSEGLSYLGAEIEVTFITSETGEQIDLKDPEDDIRVLEAFLDEAADFRGEENFAGNLASRIGEEEETVKMLGVEEFLDFVKGDNSYNWTHTLTPVNWNLYKLESGELVSEIKVNHGGDPRGNYGPSYYFFEDDEEDAVKRFHNLVLGFITVVISFQV